MAVVVVFWPPAANKDAPRVEWMIRWDDRSISYELGDACRCTVPTPHNFVSALLNDISDRNFYV